MLNFTSNYFILVKLHTFCIKPNEISWNNILNFTLKTDKMLKKKEIKVSHLKYCKQ